MNVRSGEVHDDDLLAEQIDFYRADAEAFDVWLGGLLDENNDEQIARTYRAGRVRIAEVFRQRAPLGRVLEVAAGTGRLAELYAPHADAVVLLDPSPESLAIAARRVGVRKGITFDEADIFEWDCGGHTFDLVVFTAWLHHVPHTHFDQFWRKIDSLLAPTGRVIFDFPDATLQPPRPTELPEEPSDDYGFYAPTDGVSVRDHFGRRWRVVHNLWHVDELRTRLEQLGWTMRTLGVGLFADIVWAEARR